MMNRVRASPKRIRDISAVAWLLSYGVEIDVTLRNVFDVLMNAPRSDHCLCWQPPQNVVGADLSSETTEQAHRIRSFADMP